MQRVQLQALIPRHGVESNVLAAAVNVGLGGIAAAASTLLLGKLLGLTLYGEVGHQLAFAALSSAITMLGFNNLMSRQAATSAADDPVFRRQLTLAFQIVIAASVAVGIAYVLVAGLAPNQSAGKAMLTALLLILGAITGVASSLLIGLGHAGKGLAVGWLSPGFWTLFVAITKIGFGVATVESALIGAVLASCISLAVLGFWVWRILPPVTHAEPTSRREAIPLIKLGLPFLVIGALDVAQTSLPTMLVSAFGGYYQTGVFLVATQITTAIALPVGAISWGVTSQLGHFIRDREAAGAIALFRRARKWSAGVGIAVALVIMPLSPFVLTFLGSTEAAAFWPLLILVLAQVVNAATGPNIAFNLLLYLQRYVSVVMAVSLVAGVAATVLIAPVNAAIGGAVGVAVILIVSCLALTWSIRGTRPAARIAELNLGPHSLSEK